MTFKSKKEDTLQQKHLFEHKHIYNSENVLVLSLLKTVSLCCWIHYMKEICEI